MLRPATPLAVALFAAFALLLLSVLSTPIIKAIPLCSFEGVTFGVFGFCLADGNCSPIEIGYDTGSQFSADDSITFSLPAATRNTLSTVLIIHPVACLLTLSMFIMAVTAHFHSPSHSVRYLLLVFITSIFTFLASLLSFLVDVLLFSPHMAFGSWLVLAATILVALAGIVSCAMRRTLVSRKSRQKRVAENAEMSGENFYNRQAANATAASVRQPTMPVISGANGDGEKLPVFASFEKKDDRSSDERIPLTARSPSDRSPNGPPNDMMAPRDMQMMNAPPPGMRRSPSVPRDQYGNPIGGPPDGYGPRRGPSFERMNSRGRGGMPPGGYRGRGNYGPPGRGGGYGPPPGRGGYGPPARGGYGPPPGRGGYGPPPRGYGSVRGRGPPPGYQYERGGPYGVRGPSPGPPSAPGYSNPSLPSVSAGGFEAYNPERTGSLPRAESPPPLPSMNDPTPPGQAVEMDATTGSPQHPPKDFGQFGQIRDSDADIAGMVGLQQGMPPNSRRHDTYMSETSRYSQEDGEYVPPRANWNTGRNSPRMPSPLNVPGRTRTPTTRSPPPAEAPNSNQYFEDIDPRFAEPAQRPTPPPLQTSHSYEDIPQGARSPAESERSNFTSISQRGVNPRWHPPPPTLMPGYNGQQIPRRPPRNSSDQLVLNSNPDFALPANRGNSPPRKNTGGMIPGSSYPAL